MSPPATNRRNAASARVHRPPDGGQAGAVAPACFFLVHTAFHTSSKHDDQVDSTAQFLDWFKKPYPGQGILEYYRMRAERRQNPENPERYRVRLQAPSGMGSVQTFSGRHINVSPDGTIEMSADDAQYLIRAGWTKLAEWTRDEAA